MEGVELRLEVVDLLVLRQRGGLQTVCELAATRFETCDGLLQRGALLAGRGEHGDLGDAEDDVVEGRDVAIDGQHLRYGVRVLIGDGEQRRQGGLEIGLDGGDVGLVLLAYDARDLPLLGAQRGEGLVEVVERRLEECGWGCGFLSCRGWGTGGRLRGESGEGRDKKDCGEESRHGYSLGEIQPVALPGRTQDGEQWVSKPA